MKRKIQVWEYAGQILDAVGKGVLLTTKAKGKVNTMTIGWGTLGVEWKEPIFTAFVRQSRYTKELLDESGEFTISIPVGEVDGKILSYCGTKSGRGTDKIQDMGLTLEEPETVSAPGIRQLPLTLECKVIYTQEQELTQITAENRARFYQQGTANEGDVHTAYYGKITAAYIIE